MYLENFLLLDILVLVAVLQINIIYGLHTNIEPKKYQVFIVVL